MNNTLVNRGYIFIPGYISQKEALELAAGFESYARVMGKLGDVQAPSSRSVYNYSPFLALMMRKINWLSELVQEPLLPTYNYARVYSNGEVLEPHTDRDACEISVTLNLDQCGTPWPIFMVDAETGNRSPVILEPGDAVVYKGCDIEHYRHAFKGIKHTQVFMHHVLANGDRSWAVFDKVQTPPEPSKTIALPVKRANTPVINFNYKNVQNYLR